MKRTLILGGGMVGSAMAMDLAASDDLEVTLADVRADTLEGVGASLGIATIQADLSDPATVGKLAAGHDVVLGALPSVLGLQTLKAVIEAGTDYCDISFMPENALELDDLARNRGVTAVVDCGVSPGLSNMMVGHAVTQLDPCERLEIYVGGVPVRRTWPFDYKAGFAPHDVIEVYVRPARIVEHGQIVVKEALSEPELMDFAEIGTLEAFNTDGLRSLAHTLKVPFMKEKTLRYPGHVALMRAFRETGLFSKELQDVGGQRVRPLDLTAALLFPKWTFQEGEADMTVMRVVVQGQQKGQSTTYRWDLLDRYDASTGLRSMSRTTAFPATIVARLISTGAFRRPGVCAPEVLGREPGILDTVIGELEQRGVRCSASVERTEPASAATPVGVTAQPRSAA